MIVRGRENQVEINKRLSLAVQEMNHYVEYKYILVNDSINQTVENVLKIIQYEELLLKIYKKVKSVKML